MSMPATIESEVRAPTVTPSAPADDRAPLAAWYLQRRSRMIWIVPVSAALAAFFVLLLLRGTVENPKANFEQTQKAMLALAPPEVPKSENAAADYTAARTAAGLWTGLREDSPDRNLTKDRTFFESAAVKAYFSANSKRILCLMTGAAKEKCNFGIDYSGGPAILLPHLGQMRDNARFLAAYARYLAQGGDHQGAAASLSAAYKMAQHVSSDPLLICGLVSISMSNSADDALEGILVWDPPQTAADIAGYRAALSMPRPAAANTMRFLTAEKTFALNAMDMLASKRISTSALGPPFGSSAEIESDAYLLFGYGSDRHCCAHVMDEYIETVRHNAFVRKDEVDSLIRRHQTGPAVMTIMLLPMLGRGGSAFLRSEDSLRLAGTALAVLEFRIKYKRNPKTLDDLVPEFLAEVPCDPYHHLPLRIGRSSIMDYENSKREFKPQFAKDPPLRVYSFGENGRDDSGVGEGPCTEAGIGVDDKSFLLPPFQENK